MFNQRNFILKKGDTLPVLNLCLYDHGCLAQKRAFNMTGATAVTFSMVDASGNYKIANRNATLVDVTGGTIQYNWQTGDTNEAGLFKAQFLLQYTSGRTMSVPQSGFIVVEIMNGIIPL